MKSIAVAGTLAGGQKTDERAEVDSAGSLRVPVNGFIGNFCAGAGPFAFGPQWLKVLTTQTVVAVG